VRERERKRSGKGAGRVRKEERNILWTWLV